MNFVFDLDGTIVFEGQPITEEIEKALLHVQMLGHEVIFASARPIRDMLPVVPVSLHTCRMIGGNGAFRYEQGQIEVTYFKEEFRQLFTSWLITHNLRYLADSDWNYSYTGEEHVPIFAGIDPLGTAQNVPIDELKAMSKLLIFSPPASVVEALEELPVSKFLHQSEDVIDISPVGVNKRKGLAQLGVTDYIAFGNDANDAPLFEGAVFSVCVDQHEVGNLADERVAREEVAHKIKEVGHRFEKIES